MTQKDLMENIQTICKRIKSIYLSKKCKKRKNGYLCEKHDIIDIFYEFIILFTQKLQSALKRWKSRPMNPLAIHFYIILTFGIEYWMFVLKCPFDDLLYALHAYLSSYGFPH